MDTGSRNAKGRPIFRGPRGGLYVISSGGRKRPPAQGRKPKLAARAWRKVAPRAAQPSAASAARTSSSPAARSPLFSRLRSALARRVVANAALAQARTKGRGGPLWLAGSRVPVARNANGTNAVDPVTLERIPARRAIKVGKAWFDIKTVSELIQRGQSNPLTRQPFDANTVRRVAAFRKQGAATLEGAAEYVASNMPKWLREFAATPVQSWNRVTLRQFLAYELRELPMQCVGPVDSGRIRADVGVYDDDDPAEIVVTLRCDARDTAHDEIELEYHEIGGGVGRVRWYSLKTPNNKTVRHINGVPPVLERMSGR